MRFIVGGFHKEWSVEAFANQTPLHVNKTCKHGINLVICDGFFQCIESQLFGHLMLRSSREKIMGAAHCCATP
ncbi:hypothetical protein D9M72_542720 [compost metagenome]